MGFLCIIRSLGLLFRHCYTYREFERFFAQKCSKLAQKCSKLAQFQSLFSGNLCIREYFHLHILHKSCEILCNGIKI